MTQTEPLENFVSHFLSENWHEDHADLAEAVEDFVSSSAPTEVVALIAAINAALAEFAPSQEWPTELWPFDEADAPPHAILPAISAALVELVSA